MTEHDWWSYFANGLPDDMTLLAFADWLEEQNDPRAAGVRWLQKRRLSPVFSRPHTTLRLEECPSYDWWSWSSPRPAQHKLPSDIFTALPAPHDAGPNWARSSNFREYPSAIGAFQALITAITSLGDKIDVCPSGGVDRSP